MIVYGTKATLLTTQNITEKCTSCQTSNSISISVFQKYAHIFWIPLFPMSKIGGSQCSHCKQLLQSKEFNSSLSEKYEEIKTQLKTPIWTFSGLAIIIFLIIAGIINDKQNDAKNAKIILAPQKNDVYEIKISDKQYTLYKVDTVVQDTVFLLINQYETDNVTGISKLKDKGDDSYSDEVMPVLKSKLKTMLSKGEILDIDRK